MEQNFDLFVGEYQKQMDSLISPFGSKHSHLVDKKIDLCAQLVKSFRFEVKNILDFGSGVGLALPGLVATFPKADIEAVDISKEALEISKRSFGGQVDHRLITDRQIPLASESVDLAFSSGVFHHIPQNERFHWLTEINMILRKDGMAIIFEHNPFHPVTRWIVNKCSWDQGFELMGLNESLNLFSNAGFNSIGFKYHLIFPPKISILQKLEWKLGKLPIGAQYCVYGLKN